MHVALPPDLMTTMAELLGALPLALGTDTVSELRRPLGITIIGGLIMRRADVSGRKISSAAISQRPKRACTVPWQAVRLVTIYGHVTRYGHLF
jgi:hypothetical protein